MTRRRRHHGLGATVVLSPLLFFVAGVRLILRCAVWFIAVANRAVGRLLDSTARDLERLTGLDDRHRRH